jgi:hypothetical protein
VPAAARVVPEQPAFPPSEELVRVVGAHDLTPVGPPLTLENCAAIAAAAR